MPESLPKTSPETDPETAARSPEQRPEESPAPTDLPREPLLGLSMTQVIGGSAAAATAAALGSRLGLIGTVVGAALISVVTAVAGAVYSRSLQRTKEVVARAGERLPTVRIPAQRAPQSRLAEPTREPGTTPRWWHRVRWRPVVVTAVAVFLLAGGIVTAIEALTGRSLDGTGRTSVAQLVHRDDSGQTRTPTDQGRPYDQSTGSGGSRERDGSGTGQADTTPSPTPSAEPTDGASDNSQDSGDGQGSGSPATERPTPTPTPTSTPTSGSSPSAKPTTR